eukprot:m.92880 g.92880  ORF g.92880 m.92880 type:complete len:179 (-) comp16524_c0_seq4:445-981(-)
MGYATLRHLGLLCLFITSMCAEVNGDSHSDDEKPLGLQLQFAVGEGQWDEVERLLKQDAPVQYLNRWKETALHHTAIKNDVSGLELLIKYGADVNAITDGEYEGHEVRLKRSVLQWWAVNCNIDAIKILVREGVDVHYKDEAGDTALDHADRLGVHCKAVRSYLREQMAATGRSGDDL